MLKIVIDSDFLLDIDGVVLDFELNSPISVGVEIEPSYGYNFNLKKTPNNMRILNYPHRITNKTPLTTSFNASVFFNVKLFDATLTITEAGDVYKASLGVLNGDFFAENKDKSLQDLQLGKVSDNLPANTNNDPNYFANVIAPYLQSQIFKQYPETHFAIFPVHNDSFKKETNYYEESLQSITPYQNNWQFHYVNQVIGYFATSGHPITPFLYNLYVLNNVFSQSGYILNDAFFKKNNELASLVLFNLNDINGTIERTLNSEWSKCLPDLPIKEYLKQLANYFNLAISFSNGRVCTIRNIDEILLSNDIVDFKDNIIENPIIERNEHTGTQLELNIDEGDKYFSETFKDIWQFRNNIKGNVNDIIDLPLTADENDLYLVISKNRYYIYQYNTQSLSYSWVEFSTVLQNFQEEEFSKTIPVECAPLDMKEENISVPTDWTAVMIIFNLGQEIVEGTHYYTHWFTHAEFDYYVANPAVFIHDYGNYSLNKPIEDSGTNWTYAYLYANSPWRVPIIQQKGNFRTRRKELEKFGLRLLFYRGIMIAENGVFYPYASSDEFSYKHGLPLSWAKHSLNLNGEKGIVNNFYKHTLNWLFVRKPVSLTKYMTPTEIKNFDFLKKHNIGNANVIITKLNFSISQNNISNVKIEAYTI